MWLEGQNYQWRKATWQSKLLMGTLILALVAVGSSFKNAMLNILANLFLLALGGCDVVLGVDWLRSLGTIQWNFADLSMSFWVEGKKLLLQGLRLPEKTIQEEHNLSKVALVEGRRIWLQFMEINDSLGGASVEPAI